VTIIRSNSPGARKYLTHTCADYAAKAINERPTIADLSRDVRLELTRCLKRLGMPAALAAAVAQA
jgi:hypothetical protein